jgi:hypothetical protein
MDHGDREQNAKLKIAHDAIATIVRPVSAVAFICQLLMVAFAWSWKSVTFNVQGFRDQLYWSILERFELLFPIIALACLAMCGALVFLRPNQTVAKWKTTNWCVWLNLITIILPLFAPAIQFA